jgi:hypothetical protein
VPIYGMCGAHLQYVWCPFTVCVVPIYGKLWCPFTVRNRRVPIYGKLRCPFTVCVVPIYGKLWCPFTVSYGAGAKFDSEKTALRGQPKVKLP